MPNSRLKDQDFPKSLVSAFPEAFDNENPFLYFSKDMKYSLQLDLKSLYDTLSITNPSNITKFVFSIDESGPRTLTRIVNYVIPRIQELFNCKLIDIKHSSFSNSNDASDYTSFSALLIFEKNRIEE